METYAWKLVLNLSLRQVNLKEVFACFFKLTIILGLTYTCTCIYIINTSHIKATLFAQCGNVIILLRSRDGDGKLIQEI